MGTNDPVEVNVRIEDGIGDRVLFAGNVKTKGHEVETRSGFKLLCDGTNNHENPLPGPTCIAALEDAVTKKQWDGTYYLSMDDIMVTEIKGVKAEANKTYWSVWVNFKFATLGGGQLQIKEGDSLLYALISQTGQPIPLKLTGPRSVPIKDGAATFTVTVINGSDRSPVSGAMVIGGVVEATTDELGVAEVTLHDTGKLRATKNDGIASNEINVEVKT